MDINQIGLLLAYQRTKRNISVAELCEGICSRGFIEHVENGERGCEKIVAETLLQRAGFASDQMLYFLEKEEAERLTVKEKLLTAVFEMKIDEVETLTKEYQKLTHKKSILHSQFLMLLHCILRWKLYQEREEKVKETLDYLEKDLRYAWEMTRAKYDIEGKCPRVLGNYEWLIRLLFYQVQEAKGKKEEVLLAYEDMLQYMEETMESAERAKFYPMVAYHALLLYEQVGGEKEQEALYQKCLDLLKKEAVSSFLLELCIYRRRYLGTKEQTTDRTEEMRNLKDLEEALRWLYTTYNITPDWLRNMLFGREEVYYLPETIRKRRRCLGMTQEELAEGICEPVTMSRIETGTSSCKRGRVGVLMDRLRLPGGAAVFSVQAGQADTYGIVSEIRRLSALARYEEAEPLFAKLKETAGDERCAAQFILHKEATIQRNLKQIDDMTHWNRQKEALHFTVPEKEPGELKDWVFTRTEAMIIIGMSYGCKKIGKAKETIAWLRLLKDYYEQQQFCVSHYVRGYELALKDLANLLDQTQEYETAIMYEDTAIRLALELDITNVLCLNVYGKSWNMEQLWESGAYTKEDSRPYLKAAVALSRIYAKPSARVFLREKWERLYGMSID